MVTGLRGGVLYRVRVRATVAGCESDLKENIIQTDDDYFESENTFDGDDGCTNTSESVDFSISCQYRCNDGSCINNRNARCNWVKECLDGSDEWNCTCSGFTCGNGACIDEAQRCDGRVHCNDLSD